MARGTLTLRRFNRGPVNNPGAWKEPWDDTWKGFIQSAFLYGGKVARECAEDLLKKSNEKVPIGPTHHLVESGQVDIVDSKSEFVAYRVSYDTRRNDEESQRDNYNYAVRIHEDLSLNHPNGGEAKFLENAYRENSDKYLQLIRDEIRQMLGRSRWNAMGGK
jgi:hypothetical protein